MDFVSCRLMGGLGNYMFQISTAYSLSLRDNKDLICDYSDNMVPHKPYKNYINNIFRKIKFSNSVGDYTPYREKGFNYSEIPKIEGNVKIFGYYQSEKYFKNFRNEILDLFEIDEKTNDKLHENYSELINHNNTCSIHVRRGDYVRLSDYHKVQDIQYFINSYNEMGEDKKYLIFSDDPQWCKENFDFIKDKVFIEGNNDYEDLYLMSLCKNNITCNSTFSWWGAWLNKNNGKTIIPSQWFGHRNSHLNSQDLYCENWIKI